MTKMPSGLGAARSQFRIRGHGDLRNVDERWKKDRAALEKLFRSLPIERGTAENIPYELLISNIPDELLLMRAVSKKKRPRSAGAKKSLGVLAQSTRRTINALEALSPKALAKVNYRPVALRELITRLKILGRLQK
jgi:hypothetical protein